MSDDSVYARCTMGFDMCGKKNIMRYDILYDIKMYSVNTDEKHKKRDLRELVKFVYLDNKTDFDTTKIARLSNISMIYGFKCYNVKIPNSYFKTKGAKTSENKI